MVLGGPLVLGYAVRAVCLLPPQHPVVRPRPWRLRAGPAGGVPLLLVLGYLAAAAVAGGGGGGGVKHEWVGGGGGEVAAHAAAFGVNPVQRFLLVGDGGRSAVVGAALWPKRVVGHGG